MVLGLAALGALIALEVGGHFTGLRQYGVEFLHRLPRGEASFYTLYLLIGLPGALLFALGLSLFGGRRPFERGLRSLENLPDGAFQAGLAVAGMSLVSLVAFVVLRDMPVTDDEWVYLFQADLLSRGRLFEPSAPLREFFDNVFIVNNGKWYGKYPPGHPLLLVLGTVVGLPRLLPILLAGINLILTYRLACELTTRNQARVAALLLLASPFFLATGATLLSHTTCLTALLVMGLGVARAARTGRRSWGVVAGVGAGVAFLARPYTALLIGLPVAAAWGWVGSLPAEGRDGTVRPRRQLAPWITGLGVAAIFLVLFLAQNAVLTGNPLRTGYAEIEGQRGQVIGFGEVIPGRITHSPLSGLGNVGLVLARLNFWTFGWPLSWLFIIAALLWARNPRLQLLRWILGAVACGSIFYFSIGVSDTGPVKYYELLPILAILSAAGLAALDARIATSRRPGLSALAPALVLGLTLFSWGFFSRVQAGELLRLSDRVAEPYRAVERLEEPRILIFSRLLQRSPFDSWVFSTPNNLPETDRRILYVRDLGDKNRELVKRYSDRAPYLLERARGGAYTLTRISGDDVTRRRADELVRQGIQFLREMNSRDAIMRFGEAVETDPDNATAFKYLGWSLEQANLNDRAEPAFRRAIELSPNAADVRYFFGRFLARRGRWQEAEVELMQAVSLDHKTAEYGRVLDMVRRKQTP